MQARASTVRGLVCIFVNRKFSDLKVPATWSWANISICAMGQRSSCCSEEVQEAPKVEVVHHRQEFENTNWKVCVPIEAQEVQDSRAEPTTTNTAIPSRTSLAQYRLQKMDHLVVDRDILRGIPLREFLP